MFTASVAGAPQGGVISPLLSNIFLHAFDRAWAEHGTGELVRYVDDFVVLCRSAEQAERAQQQARALLGELGLALHPDKTRVVDLREGKEGFDFLGCHLRARMSGELWEQKRSVGSYLHRCPSPRSMKRARARIRDLTDRRRVGMELDDVIGVLYLWRLKRLLIKKHGRNLRAGQAGRWTEAGSTTRACLSSCCTIRYPKAA